MADIRVVDGEGNSIEAPVEVSSDPAATVIPDGLLLRERVAQVFDLKPSEASKYGRQIDGLIEYAKLKTEDHSPEGLKWAIRQLSLKVGTPPLGEKLLPYLHRYAYLYLEGRKIEKEKQQFLRGEQD